VATATPTPSADAARTVRLVIRDSANPLTRWHLLSLDAPTVAALWTWFIAISNHIRLASSSILAMAIAVWMLYAADRLMDARQIGPRNPFETSHDDLEARHLFHHRHHNAFITGILIASIALALLLPRLEASAIHLYLFLGGLLTGYFILIHATRNAHRLPKEFAVGLFFAAATFIPTVARRPDLRPSLLPLAILFAALCSLNCLFIYAWEHAQPRATHPAHPTTRFALRHLQLLATLLILASAVITVVYRNGAWPIPLAIATSSTLLLVLHRHRTGLNRITLRAMADLVLTTPVLLVPLLHR
jgi:membrane protein YdbS with pleckstrin-like domain